MESRKESEYQVKLDYEIKRHYKQKLKFEDEELPDPYSLRSELDLLDNPKLYGQILNLATFICI